MQTAACAVAYKCVQVRAQSLLVVRETYSGPLVCLYRPQLIKWLEIPIVTTTTGNEDALLCARLHVIAYRNVLIIQLNVRVKHPWRTRERDHVHDIHSNTFSHMITIMAIE